MSIGARGGRGSVLDKGRLYREGGNKLERSTELRTGAGVIEGLPRHLPFPAAPIQVRTVPSAVQPPSHPDRSGPSRD